MKRVSNLYSRIPMYDNLCLAFWKAAKGKSSRSEVIVFKNNFHTNINSLKNQLLNHKPDIGNYHFFHVFDPKQRFICAASFPERVLHHAIMNVCEPILDSYAVFDTYACHKNKGNHKALSRAQTFAKKYKWYLKLDIKKYFDSIDHVTLLKLLTRRFKDKNLLNLFDQILQTYNCETGRGIPIGNLISQHLANFYLGTFDHWIKEDRRVKGYLRYMDDFIVYGVNKHYLKHELELIIEFLSENLKLKLKENIQLNRCSNGIPFLGYRVFSDKILLSSNSRKRFIKKFKKYEKNFVTGKWSEQILVRHMEPLFEFTKAANTISFRKAVIKRFGVSS